MASTAAAEVPSSWLTQRLPPGGEFMGRLRTFSTWPLQEGHLHETRMAKRMKPQATRTVSSDLIPQALRGDCSQEKQVAGNTA